MASFTLITQGLRVGYNEDGFFVWGTSDNFCWNDRGEYVHGEQLPRFAGELVEWRIDSNPLSLWEQFRNVMEPDEFPEREALLKKFWGTDRQPYARMERSRFVDKGASPIAVTMSLPSDPNLTGLIMGAAMSGKELNIFSHGWMFLSEDKLAPAVSYVGWQDRFEPAFSSYIPTLTVTNSQHPHRP